MSAWKGQELMDVKNWGKRTGRSAHTKHLKSVGSGCAGGRAHEGSHFQGRGVVTEGGDVSFVIKNAINVKQLG